MPEAPAPAVLLDLDGTLVDTNYQHALSWHRALRDLGTLVPVVTTHRHVGMGGDQLVTAVAGEAFEAEHGDLARELEKMRFRELAGDAAALEGATEFARELVDRGCDVVLASSAGGEDTERFLRLIDASSLKHTTSADVEATKPEPDLVRAALELVDGDRPAVLVGDSPWDVEAGARAGIPVVALLTGGFSSSELEDAGAVAVHERLADLRDGLDDLLAAARRPGA